MLHDAAEMGCDGTGIPRAGEARSGPTAQGRRQPALQGRRCWGGGGGGSGVLACSLPPVDVHAAAAAYEDAIEAYSLAIEACPEDDTASLAIFFNNRSACHLHTDSLDACLADCDQGWQPAGRAARQTAPAIGSAWCDLAPLALKHQPDYAKVLLRRAKTFERQENYERALEGGVSVSGPAATPACTHGLPRWRRLETHRGAGAEQPRSPRRRAGANPHGTCWAGRCSAAPLCRNQSIRCWGVAARTAVVGGAA